MKKIFLTLIILIALVTQGYGQDEKTTLQKVREMILDIVPDSVGLENVNARLDTIEALLDSSVVDTNAVADLNTRIDSTQTALTAKAPTASPTFTGTVSGITKTMVGLGNADNTSDVNKPVSTATQTAINLKAPIASPTFTGTVSGITKSMVGLGSVDNTSDIEKPASIPTKDEIDNAVQGIASNAEITALQIEVANLQSELDSYQATTDARLNALEGEIIIPDPLSPTNLLAVAHSTLFQIALTWNDPTSLCDSIYLYRTNGLTAGTPIAVIDSGVGSYNHTGLNEATLYTYQARTVKYINGIAVISNLSNVASATTGASDPPVLVDNSSINEDWEQGNLDSAFVIQDGTGTDGTVALGLVGAISGSYSMYSRVDSTLGYGYAWYKLPTPLADGDTVWIRFDVRPDALTGTGETSNHKTIFALGDTVSGSFRAALKFALRKQNNDTGLYEGRITNNNNTLTSTGTALDSVIELNTTARILIAMQTGYDSVDNFVKVWVSNYSTGNLQQTYATNPFTTRQSTSYIPSEYLRLGLENITTTLGDKFSYDNLVVASDSSGLFASVDTTTSGPGDPDSTGTYQSVYFVSAGAIGTGDGTQLNPYTLDQARSVVVPGDTVILTKERFNIAGKSFSKSGTQSLPIVWIGSIDADDKLYSTNSVTGDSSTLFSNSTSSSNPAFSMSGDYNKFVNIVFQQDFAARELVSVGGDGVILENCATKYPSNTSSSSNHTITVTGNNVKFLNSTFRNGSRCIIWVRKNGANQANHFLMDGCILANATNHPPIQLFPATNLDSSSTLSPDSISLKSPIIRNSTFIENTYGDGIYSRYCEKFAFYNNLFINSDGPYNIDIHTGYTYPTGTPADTLNSKGGIVAYNTIITSGQANVIFNKGSNQTKFVNNVVYSTQAAPDMIFRLDGAWNAIYRHQFDYNLYDYTEDLASGNTVRGTWGSANTSVWYYNWDNVTGQEVNSTVDVTPTWNNTNPIGGYRPPNISAPQTGKGIPVTTANGFWMNITTDAYGNTRHAVNPTIGHSNYVGE